MVPLVWDADWMSMGQVHESSLAGERRDCNVELYFCYYHINMLGVAGTTDASQTNGTNIPPISRSLN